jgi:hypothetical protein
MTKGKFLVLNFDDCAVKYEELFDPDLKELYGNMLLSPYMWTPHVFSQNKCWSNHLKNRIDLKLHNDFRFMLYSKFVIDAGLEEHDMVNVIEKRFEKCIPLKHMNFLILMNQ